MNILSDIYLYHVSKSHALKFCVFKLLIILKGCANGWLNLYKNTLKGSVFLMSMSTASVVEISHKPASTRNLVHFPCSSVWWKSFQVLTSRWFLAPSGSISEHMMGVLVLKYQNFFFVSCKESELFYSFSSLNYWRMVLGLIECDVQRLFLWKTWALWCYVHLISDVDFKVI